MLEGLCWLDKFSVRILGFLAWEPSKSYYQREIARTVGVSVGKTNQVLKVLEREEIVVKERKGRVDLYRYDLHNAVARHLKILFALTELSELIRQLRQVSKKVVIFGSCAEGTDSIASDIDLLILTSDKDRVKKLIASSRRILSRKVSPIVLNLIEFSELKDKDRVFYEQVSRGIVLWQEE